MGRGQECVQEVYLDTSDAQMGGQSPVKAEVSYNMESPDETSSRAGRVELPLQGAPARGCPRPDAIIVDLIHCGNLPLPGAATTSRPSSR